MRYRWFYLALIAVVFVAGLSIGQDAWWLTGGAIGIALIMIGYWFSGARGGAPEIVVVRNGDAACDPDQGEWDSNPWKVAPVATSGLEAFPEGAERITLETSEYGSIDLYNDSDILSMTINREEAFLEIRGRLLGYSPESEHSAAKREFLLRFEGVHHLQVLSDSYVFETPENMEFEYFSYGMINAAVREQNCEITTNFSEYRFGCTGVVFEAIEA